MALLSGAFHQKNIVYCHDVDEDLPSVTADRHALKQILIYILMNAVKFSEDGGRIDLEVYQLDQHHVFKVEDKGVGIPESELQDLTEPFFRGETHPHTTREGTGLGLAIVETLVELHDGNLEIESTIGIGTKVTASLPSRGTD